MRLTRWIGLLALVLALLCGPGTGWGAYGIPTATITGFNAANSNTFTTGTFDTTGADIIICGVSGAHAVSSAVLSDNKGNGNYTELLSTSSASGGRATIVYKTNPTVGSGHTITATGTGIAASVACMAFSGSNTTAPPDVSNSANGTSGTTLQAGSISAATNAVGFAALNAVTGTSATIDSSYTGQLTVAGGTFNYRLDVAYKINPGTTNPTWTWTTSSVKNAAIASFLPLAAPEAVLQQSFPLGLGALLP